MCRVYSLRFRFYSTGRRRHLFYKFSSQLCRVYRTSTNLSSQTPLQWHCVLCNTWWELTVCHHLPVQPFDAHTCCFAKASQQRSFHRYMHCILPFLVLMRPIQLITLVTVIYTATYLPLHYGCFLLQPAIKLLAYSCGLICSNVHYCKLLSLQGQFHASPTDSSLRQCTKSIRLLACWRRRHGSYVLFTHCCPRI